MNWMTKEQKTGMAGELWAKMMLEKRGYSVHMPNDFFERQNDFIINGVLPCEVKTSSPVSRWKKASNGVYKVYPRWVWNVQAIEHDDRAVILIATTKSNGNFAFICPSALFVNRASVEITNDPQKYRGYLSAYLNRWDVIDGLLFKRYQGSKQLELLVVAQYQEVSENA